jgi:hypothetical protein
VTFKAYLDNIEAKTGKSPTEFKDLAAKQGFLTSGKLRPDIKAGQVLAWLKKDFQLGHGHAMAIVAFLKGKRA